ncbi:uncharacterized protein LOC136067291 [Quercus suber]|uniref:uncharacterized protein LOC136067291 n=1 Tax=Quercus suber TaxID=58331 RepID=UPI0032DE7CDE
MVTTTPADMRMLKLKKFPSKLKDLLEMGILEGMPVKYVRGAKVRAAGETGLKGVIRGSGILCYCAKCKGVEVLTPTVFELHAGSANKRPPEYIYLENGNTLRDVMNACLNASLDTLDEFVQNAIGCTALKKSSICLNCREPIPKSYNGKSMLLCESCVELKKSQVTLAQTIDTSNRSPKPVLVPKSSENVSKSSENVAKSFDNVSKSFDNVSKSLTMFQSVPHLEVRAREELLERTYACISWFLRRCSARWDRSGILFSWTEIVGRLQKGNWNLLYLLQL